MLESLKGLAIEFISGAMAGFMMVASSHPFEYTHFFIFKVDLSTITTRVQMKPDKGVYKTISDLLRKEGVLIFIIVYRFRSCLCTEELLHPFATDFQFPRQPFSPTKPT